MSWHIVSPWIGLSPPPNTPLPPPSAPPRSTDLGRAGSAQLHCFPTLGLGAFQSIPLEIPLSLKEVSKRFLKLQSDLAEIFKGLRLWRLVAQLLKNPPSVWEIWVRSLGWEDPLEKGMAAHSHMLAWRMPWTEEPGGLHPWGHKKSDTLSRPTLPFHHLEISELFILGSCLCV